MNPEIYIRNRLEDIKTTDERIEISFRFIGMGISPSQKDKLSQIAITTGGDVETFFVETDQELENALKKVLIIEPGIVNADTILNLVNPVTTHLDEFIKDLNEENYPIAITHLKQALEEFDLQHLNLLILDLGKRKSNEQFKKLYELVTNSRDEQRSLIELSESMIALATEGDTTSYDSTVTEWNAARANYNSKIIEINKILNQLRVLDKSQTE